jgi:Ca2+-transporting ATPase
MTYILAIHVPIAGLSLLPVLFNWPPILLPIHIAFLHLIIDPACSVVFEAEPAADDIMRRPPRNPRERLFGRPTVLVSLLQGGVTFGVLAALYAVVLRSGQGEMEARALAFTSLIVANLGLILANRSWSRPIGAMLRVRNTALWWVTGGAVAFLALTVSLPAARALFRFSPVHADDAAICVLAGSIPVALFEAFKMTRLARRWAPTR